MCVVFCFFLVVKNVFFTFAKYQGAGEISVVHHLGVDRNKRSMDGVYRAIDTGVYRKIFSYLPAHTYSSTTSKYSKHKSGGRGGICIQSYQSPINQISLDEPS